MENTIIINNIDYSIYRMDAIEQGIILKKITPLLPKMEGSVSVDIADIVRNLDNLTDDNYRYILNACLSRTYPLTKGQKTQPLMVNGKLLNTNISIKEIFEILMEHVNLNFQDLFDIPQLDSQA